MSRYVIDFGTGTPGDRFRVVLRDFGMFGGKPDDLIRSCNSHREAREVIAELSNR